VATALPSAWPLASPSQDSVHLRGSSSAEIDGADRPIPHQEEPLDMLSEDKIMDVLEAFDLTRSYRSAAQLFWVDHHTVRRYVAARDAGLDPTSLGTSAPVNLGEAGSSTITVLRCRPPAAR